MTIPANRFKLSDDGTQAWLVFKDNEHNDAAFQWDMHDRPCDTCKDESTPGYLDNSDGRAGISCPDCIYGRHTFEIEQLCVDVDSDRCLGYCDEGVVAFTVSVVPGMVLPIYDGFRLPPEGQGRRFEWVSIINGETTLEYSPASGQGRVRRTITLPDAAAHGMTAVLLNVRTTP